ncbi:MAG: two component sensor kinase [Herbinix sp.]|jgi:signal transduction histidine kinase|nr:two component sensor kinase [Herbinix sp.]
MIKKLRIKFVAIAMGSLCLIFLLLIGAIYFSMQIRNERQTYRFMELIADNDGELLRRNKLSGDLDLQTFPNFRGVSRHFSIKLDHNNQILSSIGLSDTDLTADEMSDLLDYIVKKNKTNGSYHQYQYLIADKMYGKILVFTDYSIENSLLNRLIYTCLSIGGIGVLIFFVIIVLLSYWATKPIQSAFDKQKQFISDASHELKTPLTIINTNASVLESQVGDNKWLGYIQTNVLRMNQLVNELLDLTRMENTKQILTFHKFNLSKAILNSCLPFESTAYETGKHFNLSIPAEIYYYGNEESMKQMIIILLDNAFKYSNPDGTVSVSLQSNNGKRIIKVYNTGSGIDRADYQKIFERFYRSDASRARNTGGYGLGLAIAKSITDAHKGRISVESENGQWTTFTITL